MPPAHVSSLKECVVFNFSVGVALVTLASCLCNEQSNLVLRDYDESMSHLQPLELIKKSSHGSLSSSVRCDQVWLMSASDGELQCVCMHARAGGSSANLINTNFFFYSLNQILFIMEVYVYM